jgi:hypothetical protein
VQLRAGVITLVNPPIDKLIPLVTLPLENVLRRLGYRKGKTDESQRVAWEPEIRKLMAITPIRVIYKEQTITIQGSQIDIQGYRFTSEMVAQRFGSPTLAVLMAATLPLDLYEKSLQEKTASSLNSLVLADAVFSEKVDAGLDFLEHELKSLYARQNRVLGNRLSCGYGDFNLQHQKYFIAELGLERFGVKISENFILYPEKTVTALLPIYPIEKNTDQVIPPPSMGGDKGEGDDI